MSATRPAYRVYRCAECQAELLDDPGADPTCCSQPMGAGPLKFQRASSGTERIHTIVTRCPPPLDWSIPERPKAVWEVWVLGRCGRIDGERLGWIGARAIGVEWLMVPGVPISRGIAATVAEAVLKMRYAIEGGVHAARHIAAVDSPGA